MDQRHDALAPTRPAQPQDLAPHSLLLALGLSQLADLLLFAALLRLEISRHPLVLSGLVHKLLRVLLEHRNRVQRVLGIRVDQVRRAGNDHGADGFVGAGEVLDRRGGDGYKMCLEVLGAGGLDENFGIYDAEEGLGGQVSRLLAVQSGEIRPQRIVLIEFGADVIVYRIDFL